MVLSNLERDVNPPEWPVLTQLLAVFGLRLLQIPPVQPLAPRPRQSSLGQPWSAEEDELVRTLPPSEAAKRTRRRLRTIYKRRYELKLPDGRTKGFASRMPSHFGGGLSSRFQNSAAGGPLIVSSFSERSRSASCLPKSEEHSVCSLKKGRGSA
jgi:hypothetical protein